MQLTEKYNVGEYHSGGGCMHLWQEVDVSDIYWLINPTEKIEGEKAPYNYEPSYIPPNDENQLCMFGLDLDYLEDEEMLEPIVKILKENNVVFWRDDEPYNYFIASFKDGYKKMTDINNQILSIK